MNMNRSKKSAFGLLMLLLAVIQQDHQVAGSLRIFGRDAELYGGQQSQAPRTDMELNLGNLKRLEQPDQQQQQANFVRKLPSASSNNGPDVSPLSQYPLRHHQLKQQLASPILYNQASQQFPLQFEDEHALRRQLPEILAQAHTDKNFERALLKMLISASLRSALTNSQASSGGGYGWRSDGDGEVADIGAGSFAAGPAMSARLEQAIDELASGADPQIVSNDFGASGAPTYQQQQQYNGGQLPTGIGKREYIKPCFFNAISCAKNPFRDNS